MTVTDDLEAGSLHGAGHDRGGLRLPGAALLQHGVGRVGRDEAREQLDDVAHEATSVIA